MAYICINNGYYNTKIIYAGVEKVFKSAIREPIFEYDKTVEVDGKQWVVGDGAFDIDLNKTTSVTQKACIKHALLIAQEHPVDVVTAMPVNAYLNKQARLDYQGMIKQDTHVRDVTVYMEGMAAVLADYAWYKKSLVCLLDVGGLTINAMLIDDGQLVPDTAFSMQLGTIILEARIKKALEQQGLVNVPAYQIKYLTKHNKVLNVLKNYIEEIKQSLKKAQYPSNVTYRLTGGGALQYQDIFKTHFDAYIHPDAMWENVRGLNVVGGMLYEDDPIHQR